MLIYSNMTARYNIENFGTYINLWLDIKSLVVNSAWWVNIRVYPHQIKNKVPSWIVDEFADLIEFENLIIKKEIWQ